MKYGEQKTFTITHVDRRGRGCGLVNDRPVCADFVIPEEIVNGKFISHKKGVKKFEVEQWLKTSPHRVIPKCGHAGKCGGCAWQHIDYDYQLELKRDLLNTALLDGGIKHQVNTIIPCPEQFNYRNRMDYCVGDRGEVGLKKTGRWNQYVDLFECHLLSPLAEKILDAFRSWLQDNQIQPWNVFKQTGYVRYCVIREGKNTNQRLINIVTATGDLPTQNDLLSRLAPLATTIYHGINPLITDLSLSSQLKLLHGEPELKEKVGAYFYLIPPNSFFQTNTLMAEKLLALLNEHVHSVSAKRLLDLYCGVGFFAIGLAKAASEVLGVELDAAAINSARHNATLNNCRNVNFESAAAESLIWRDFAPDIVIVDPPRSGLHPRVINTLLEQRPTNLIYVSCKYESFIRDWQQLSTIYKLTDLQALDLFPHSPHIEIVALAKC
jgi:23S rRNA (uracil-5-)-methyltransferase RumA